MTRFSDEPVAYYSKTIEITPTGMIMGRVQAHTKDGHELRIVGLKFSIGLFEFTIEKRAQKMHKWADEYMKMCMRQEVQKVQST